MIGETMLIAVVSETLRYSTLATTLNLYGCLLNYAAHETVAAVARARRWKVPIDRYLTALPSILDT